jgi:RNA polymerase sigma-70 factor (ECF subfamily)
MHALEDVYRLESRNLYARLVRTLGEFDAAEDALQDAVKAAADLWPKQGVPDNPAGWIFGAARFRGIDILRKKRRLRPLTDYEHVPLVESFEVGDELLRLIFTCCHPSISPDAQVALTLREVCELTTEEIARAFLTPAPTVAQRIVRAKSKIREASIPFEFPAKEELPQRLDSVLKTIYLVFNEGYSSSSGETLMRAELISVATHVAREVVSLLPEPEALGLLALLLFHQSRVSTRTTSEGDIIPLEHQDRRLWNRDLIHEGSALVAQSLRLGSCGPYALQAMIAALHAEAPSFGETDWIEIVGLYDLLVNVEDSAIVELNRAVAVAMRDGPLAGIALIDEILTMGKLTSYHLSYAARAELYWRQGQTACARADYEVALRLTRQAPEKRLIERRLAEIS